MCARPNNDARGLSDERISSAFYGPRTYKRDAACRVASRYFSAPRHSALGDAFPSHGCLYRGAGALIISQLFRTPIFARNLFATYSVMQICKLLLLSLRGSVTKTGALLLSNRSLVQRASQISWRVMRYVKQRMESTRASVRKRRVIYLPCDRHGSL